MAEPFIGEIRTFSFGTIPQNWAACNGQLLSINQYQALFSLLGTTYGGDGRSTFALPNLQGRLPVHRGNGIAIGQAGGEETHTLTTNEVPLHTHTALASSDPAAAGSPAGAFWADGAKAVYAATADTAMAAGALSPSGASAPHDNQSPHLVVNFCIALAGLYPSRS